MAARRPGADAAVSPALSVLGVRTRYPIDGEVVQGGEQSHGWSSRVRAQLPEHERSGGGRSWSWI